ncbi:hypothetical protein ACG2OD_14675 [Streptomyces sp. PDY-4]|uniref:hypothetical protein n=1 Tax=Streptomyces sp. PDY-4 TaxID=3376070 RepID=UPI0037A9B69E
MVNLTKYPCVVYGCGRTANVLTDDGFIQVTHCVRCTRFGLVRRHIRRYFANITPLAQFQGWNGGK